MKLSTFCVALPLLLGAAALASAQPPSEIQPEELPIAPVLGGDPLAEAAHASDVWGPPPLPPLPYGFAWDDYPGAKVAHDPYGYQRLARPPRKTACCYGWIPALCDGVTHLFAYPSHASHHGHGHHCRHCAPCAAASCPCGAHHTVMPAGGEYAPAYQEPVYQAPVYSPPAYQTPVLDPAHVDLPQPMPDPADDARLPPPVLIGDGLPAPPAVQAADPEPTIIAPAAPVIVPNETPRATPPRNAIPQPTSKLPKSSTSKTFSKMPRGRA